MAFTLYEFPIPDAGDRMKSRTLLQFRDSPVFQDLLSVFAGEAQAFLSAVWEVKALRAPAGATGLELDVVGDLVGQARELVDFDLFVWFAPDTFLQGPDQALAWVTNAPLANSYLAGDTEYVNLIEGKIARNHSATGSVPEIQAIVRKIFGVEVGFAIVGPMTVQLLVEDRASDNVLNYLRRVVDTPSADRVYFLPLPATVEISQVLRLSDSSGSGS